MKKITILTLLPLLLLACTFSELPLLPQPAAPQPSDTAAPVLPTETFTPEIPPTFTFTPTLIGARPSSTPTETPVPTDTILYLTPPTETLTPPPSAQPQTEPTIDLQGTGFTSIDQSTDQIYWGACQPNDVIIAVQMTNPSQVSSVVLFVKFRDKATSNGTGWDKGTSMDPHGDGSYTLTLNGKGMDHYNNAWIVYQIVGTDRGGIPVARSPVFNESLTLSICP